MNSFISINKWSELGTKGTTPGRARLSVRSGRRLESIGERVRSIGSGARDSSSSDRTGNLFRLLYG